VLPTVVTIILIILAVQFLDKYFATHINNAIKYSLVKYEVSTAELPAEPAERQERVDKIVEDVHGAYRPYNWVGFVVAIIGIYIIGRLLTSFVGRSIWRLVERTFTGLPIFKAVYPSVKQVTDFLLAERKAEYSKVVAVEYPRKGMWSIGLVTGAGMRTIHDAVPGDLVTVFIPSSPTPMTGYTILVRRDEVIDLPISIDEALRFTISGGVVQPISQVVPAGKRILPEDSEVRVRTVDKEMST
jgi:uncharacterized membrane protein